MGPDEEKPLRRTRRWRRFLRMRRMFWAVAPFVAVAASGVTIWRALPG